MSSITSLDAPHTHLYPTTPSHYFQHLIITTLRQRGFDGGEAGALAEMERLLERRESQSTLA